MSRLVWMVLMGTMLRKLFKPNPLSYFLSLSLYLLCLQFYFFSTNVISLYVKHRNSFAYLLYPTFLIYSSLCSSLTSLHSVYKDSFFVFSCFLVYNDFFFLLFIRYYVIPIVSSCVDGSWSLKSFHLLWIHFIQFGFFSCYIHSTHPLHTFNWLNRWICFISLFIFCCF